MEKIQSQELLQTRVHLINAIYRLSLLEHNPTTSPLTDQQIIIINFCKKIYQDLQAHAQVDVTSPATSSSEDFDTLFSDFLHARSAYLKAREDSPQSSPPNSERALNYYLQSVDIPEMNAVNEYAQKFTKKQGSWWDSIKRRVSGERGESLKLPLSPDSLRYLMKMFPRVVVLAGVSTILLFVGQENDVVVSVASNETTPLASIISEKELSAEVGAFAAALEATATPELRIPQVVDSGEPNNTILRNLASDEKADNQIPDRDPILRTDTQIDNKDSDFISEIVEGFSMREQWSPLSDTLSRLEEYRGRGIAFRAESIHQGMIPPSVSEIDALALRYAERFASSEQAAALPQEVEHIVTVAFSSRVENVGMAPSFFAVVFRRNSENNQITPESVYPVTFIDNDTDNPSLRTLPEFTSLVEVVHDRNPNVAQDTSYVVVGGSRRTLLTRLRPQEVGDPVFTVNDAFGVRVGIPPALFQEIQGYPTGTTLISVNHTTVDTPKDIQLQIPVEYGIQDEVRGIVPRIGPKIYESQDAEAMEPPPPETSSNASLYELSRDFYTLLWDFEPRGDYDYMDREIPAELDRAIDEAVQGAIDDGRIGDTAQDRAVWTELLRSLSFHESRWELSEASDNNGIASGYFQITYGGNNRPHLDQANDVEFAARFALDYLLREYQKDRDFLLAVATYNGGNIKDLLSYRWAAEVVADASRALFRMGAQPLEPNEEVRDSLPVPEITGMRDFYRDHAESEVVLRGPVIFADSPVYTWEFARAIPDAGIYSYDDLYRAFLGGRVSAPLQGGGLHLSQRFNNSNPDLYPLHKINIGADYEAEEGDVIYAPFDGFTILYNGPYDALKPDSGTGPHTIILRSDRSVPMTYEGKEGRIYMDIVIGHSSTDQDAMQREFGLSVGDRISSGVPFARVGGVTEGNATNPHLDLTMVISFVADDGSMQGVNPEQNLLFNHPTLVLIDVSPFFQALGYQDLVQQPVSSGETSPETTPNTLEILHRAPLPLLISSRSNDEARAFWSGLTTPVQVGSKPTDLLGDAVLAHSDLIENGIIHQRLTPAIVMSLLREIGDKLPQESMVVLDLVYDGRSNKEAFMDEYRELIEFIRGKGLPIIVVSSSPVIQQLAERKHLPAVTASPESVAASLREAVGQQMSFALRAYFSHVERGS